MLGRVLRLTLAASLFAPSVSAERSSVVGAAPDTLAVRSVTAAVRPDPLPSPRWGHGTAVAGGHLYVFGGWDGGRWSDDAFSLDPATGRWAPLGRMPFAPTTAAAVADRNRIIVAGGPSESSAGWSAGPSLGQGRFLPGVARLKDGRILAAGGFDQSITTLDSVEIFDPARGVWSPAAPMGRSRYAMVFALLNDGRVLAAGGRQNSNNTRQEDIADDEIYDPTTDSWTPTGRLREPLDGALTFVRPDGFVLAIGGGFANGIHTAATELYDPRTGRWSDGPSLSVPRISGAGVKLKDGRFMVAGGVANGPTLASAEVYDPATDRWTTVAPMNEPRFAFTLTLLPDGRVLATGGSRPGGGVRSAEIYDPASDSWTPTTRPRYAHSSGTSLVVGERALIVGGSDESGLHEQTEFFDPASGDWTPGPRLANRRVLHAMMDLGKEGVIVFGGGPGGYPEPALATSEILAPSRERGGGSEDRASFFYDPGAGRWSPLGPLSHARAGLSLVAAAGGVYALGGVGRDGWGAADYDSLEGGRWRLGGDLPHHFSNAATSVFRGKVYAAGGASAPRGEPVRSLADFVVFDPADGHWTTLPAMPTARVGAAAAALEGSIYVVGGTAGLHAGALDVVEVYDLAQRAWTRKARLPRAVRDATASALGGRLYVVGGSPRDNAALATVQVYDPKSDSWSLSEPTPPPSVIFPMQPSVLRAPPITPVAPNFPAPAVAVARFAAKSAERPHDFALVIGVGYYKSLPAADYAENDARDAAAALRALGVPEENTVTLIGAKATLSEVSKYVEEWLPRRVSEDSRVYFYFSGHGSPDVKDGSAYLMPWDGDAAFVKSTGFPLTRLYASLGELKVARVTAMIDSCFSGAGGRSVLVAGVRPLVTVKLPDAPSPKITVLAAAEGEEIAGSFPERGHGLFTYYLIEGLTGAAAPAGAEHLTIEELYRFVRKGVILGARRQGREQNPTLRTPNGKLRLY
ncbi:MAG: hypothetical protein HY079_02060 [Elusimicrobia bacterium]|nr:hypothetical protein [Elusimicrobiota bacterium]